MIDRLHVTIAPTADPERFEVLHVHSRGKPPVDAVELLGTDHADARKPRVGDTLRATLSPDDGRVIGVWAPLRGKRGSRGKGRLFFLDRVGTEATLRLAERRGLRPGQVLAQLAFEADYADRLAMAGEPPPVIVAAGTGGGGGSARCSTQTRIHAAVEARADVLRELE